MSAVPTVKNRRRPHPWDASVIPAANRKPVIAMVATAPSPPHTDAARTSLAPVARLVESSADYYVRLIIEVEQELVHLPPKQRAAVAMEHLELTRSKYYRYRALAFRQIAMSRPCGDTSA